MRAWGDGSINGRADSFTGPLRKAFGQRRQSVRRDPLCNSELNLQRDRNFAEERAGVTGMPFGQLQVG